MRPPEPAGRVAGAAETEAESVAFIVCTVLGLDVGDVAATYVGGWTDGNPDTNTAAQAARRGSPAERRHSSDRPCAPGRLRGTSIAPCV